MSDRTKSLRPFLRWAGGKRWLCDRLRQMVPDRIDNYYEPFLGGGSLFFSLLPTSAVLADLNEPLIEAYQSVRDEPEKIIAALEQWPNEESTFYKVRNSSYQERAYRSAQLIYLNRTCWNGLYRVNRSGGFNVPFAYHGRAIFESTHLLEISSALQTAEFRHGDFFTAVQDAKKGDFVYFDPPYITHHSQNGFVQYNKKLFSWEDQERLGRTAVELVERGCHVVVTNASYEPLLSFYPGFRYQTLSRSSVLAANPKFRHPTTEFLIYSPDIIAKSEKEKGGRK